MDFLDYNSDKKMEVILMNPPFSEEWDHIQHAYELLDDGGILISIASAMVIGKESKRGKEFTKWYKEVCGYDYRLPENSFKESGAGVNTKMLVFTKEY